MFMFCQNTSVCSSTPGISSGDGVSDTTFRKPWLNDDSAYTKGIMLQVASYSSHKWGCVRLCSQYTTRLCRDTRTQKKRAERHRHRDKLLALGKLPLEAVELWMQLLPLAAAVSMAVNLKLTACAGKPPPGEVNQLFQLIHLIQFNSFNPLVNSTQSVEGLLAYASPRYLALASPQAHSLPSTLSKRLPRIRSPGFARTNT